MLPAYLDNYPETKRVVMSLPKRRRRVTVEMYDFVVGNFKHVLGQRNKAENALKDIRDGKDSPSFICRRIVYEAQWRATIAGSEYEYSE